MLTAHRFWMTLTSGDLVTGTPRPSRDFVDGTFQALILRHHASKKLRLPIKDLHEREAASIEQATAEIKPFNVNVDSGERQAITLVDVRVLWSGRPDGANIPAVRINLDAVALWWIAGGAEFKGGTGKFFVGVAIPIDTD